MQGRAVLRPRLLPISATDATESPSPSENVKLIIFMPIWCVAYAVVPRFATVMANSKKPMRRKICSTNALEPTLSSERTSNFEAKKPFTPRIYTNEDFANMECKLIAQPEHRADDGRKRRAARAERRKPEVAADQ